MRPHLGVGRARLAVALGGLVVTTLFESIGVGLLMPLLSIVVAGGNSGNAAAVTGGRPMRWLQEALPGKTLPFYLLLLCGLVLLAVVAKNATLYASSRLAAHIKRDIQVNLRDALFRRMHGTELGMFEQRTAGELTSVFLAETIRVTGTFEALFQFAQRASFALFYLGALLLISWQLTLLTVALGALIGGAVSFLYTRLARGGAAMAELNRALAARLTESFAGVRVIRTTHSQSRELARFHAANTAHADTEAAGARASSLLAPLVEIVAVTGAIIIVGVGYLLLVRTGRLPPPYLLTFGFVLLRLLPLLNQLYTFQGHLAFMAGGVFDIQQWLELPLYPARPFGERPFAGVRDAIRFENVSFHYANGRAALDDVSLEIPAGKTVALAGASGAGKTTVAALLLRLRQPTRGAITVDGEDIRTFAPASWHQAVAVVEQEAFLFHDTLRANIAYGCPEATPENLARAVRDAFLEGVVRDLPQGLDTVVGERGAQLSGGQRQRLAIARALVRNPQILILDEATSALDSVSEAEVQAALNRAREGRTVLVIAHRLSTIRHADEIVVMAAGRVVERGTWAELETRPNGVFGAFLASAVR